MPRYLLLLSLVFFGIGFFAVRFPGMPGAGVVSLISTILIALPTLVAFWRFLDAGVATLSLIALSILGFTIETTGVVTGFPYGEFYYSNALGPKIAGTVPCTLPLSWVPLVIGALAAARPQKDGGRLWRPLWVLMTVVLLVAIDGVLDPGAASLGFWTWPEGGVYYGVPLSNYAGWLLSSTLASAVVLILGDWWKDMIPVPGLLDSSIIALAFWTAVALSTKLTLPALLGSVLIAYLLIRRRKLSAWAFCSAHTRAAPKGRAPRRPPPPGAFR